MLAEWSAVKALLLAWPDQHTDWAQSNLAAIQQAYIDWIEAITPYADVWLLCHDPLVTKRLSNQCQNKVRCLNIAYNDTWTRDYGPISLTPEHSLDFIFNGWGGQFDATADNQVNQQLQAMDLINCQAQTFILEGGSVDSNGKGDVITTAGCLFHARRNQQTPQHIIDTLKNLLHAQRVHVLQHGHLEGDDTHGHIDTLARFCDANTVAYVACDDSSDPHYEPLAQMKTELEQLTNNEGLPFKLIPLPLPAAQFADDGHRLPATYANFVFCNQAVFVPQYGDVNNDLKALEQLTIALPHHTIIPINAREFIEQHGSLHCACMQIYAGAH